MIQVGVHDLRRAPGRSRIGLCEGCGRERTMRTSKHCQGCYDHRKWRSATGPQTVLVALLCAGDVIIQGESRWKVISARLEPCEIAPKVLTFMWCLPDGPYQTARLPADVYVPVEVPDAS